ncbi:MAG: HEAT repeat domain-containing protein, partial [Armatimonadota bacterium]|nr:HEAT repeat domain-containing protein [Armatimonadota bacterium]
MRADGSPAFDHGQYICYSSETARGWGIEWGRRILWRCPRFDEIIVYNPLNLCQCPQCLAARARGVSADDAVWRFLEGARAAWRAIRPEVKLGVVAMPRAEFWALGEGIVDSARPFIVVHDDASLEESVTAAQSMGEVLPGRLAACLAKVEWAGTREASPETLAELTRLSAERALPHFIWTLETLFLDREADAQANAEALGLEPTMVEPLLAQAGGAVTDAEIDALFDQLGQPEEAQNAFIALARAADCGDEEIVRAITERAIQVIDDRAQPPARRAMSCALLTNLAEEEALPVLVRAIADESPAVRTMAAGALGYLHVPAATAALREAIEGETDPRVRDLMERALRGQFKAPKAEQPTPPTEAERPWWTDVPESVSLERALEGRQLTLVLVQDLMRIENTGPQVRDVELQRYFPPVDGEQVVLARWAEAKTADRADIPIALAAVQEDTAGNPIHTWRLERMPEDQQVTVVVRSVVARRERRPPVGKFPILAAEEYPDEVRPFLRTTPMVAADHPEVAAEAEAILAVTNGALEFARELARRLRDRPYDQLPHQEHDLPTAVSVLRYGGSCCGSAVAAAAVFRAAGIPAQLTYVPGGFIHGIVKLYLHGYGWVRMDATCGSAKVPLIQEATDLSRARLFDMPIAMEEIWFAYGWPYRHNDAAGEYTFMAQGQALETVRFLSQGSGQSSSALLTGIETQRIPATWQALMDASQEALLSEVLREFTAVTELIP